MGEQKLAPVYLCICMYFYVFICFYMFLYMGSRPQTKQPWLETQGINGKTETGAFTRRGGVNCLRGLRPPPPRVQEKGRVAQPARRIYFTCMGLNNGVPVPGHTGHHRPSATLTRSEVFGRGRKKISLFFPGYLY